MKKLHHSLERKSALYANWHKAPYSTAVHYLLLLGFIVYVGINFISLGPVSSTSLVGQAYRPFEDLNFRDRMKGQRELGGEEAIRALGYDISRVARHYGFTARDLRNEFRTSKNLFINKDALLFYVDDPIAEAPKSGGGGNSGGGSGGGGTPSPTPDTPSTASPFKLHSKPNASAKVFLDFDGATVSNTSWNATGTITTLPYTLDADPAFSTAELTEIENIWRGVAEDFSAFNVDITTEEPTNYDIYHYMRIIITPSWEWFGQAGGVSFINSFRWGDGTPAFVFSSLLGNNTKYIAEATSHETGHTLGLRHQSVYDTNGAKIAEYNPGWGTGPGFAPIMGVSYYRGVTVFIDSSEYVGWASSSTYNTQQNDIGIITAPSSTTGDLRFATDETGSEPTPAQQLNHTITNGVASINQYGILIQNDIDLYRIDALDGDIKITVSPTSGSLMGNADFRVRLLDSTLNILSESNPPAVGVAYVEKLGTPAGIYYLQIVPSGYTDPTSSWWYTVTSSMGQYNVTGTYVPSTSSTPPPSSGSDTTAPAVSISSPLNGETIKSSVTISVSATDNVKVTSIEVLIDGSVTRSTSKTSLSYKWSTRGVSSGAHTITARAYDAAGNIGESSVTVYK